MLNKIYLNLLLSIVLGFIISYYYIRKFNEVFLSIFILISIILFIFLYFLNNNNKNKYLNESYDNFIENFNNMINLEKYKLDKPYKTLVEENQLKKKNIINKRNILISNKKKFLDNNDLDKLKNSTLPNEQMLLRKYEIIELDINLLNNREKQINNNNRILINIHQYSFFANRLKSLNNNIKSNPNILKNPRRKKNIERRKFRINRVLKSKDNMIINLKKINLNFIKNNNEIINNKNNLIKMNKQYDLYLIQEEEALQERIREARIKFELQEEEALQQKLSKLQNDKLLFLQEEEQLDDQLNDQQDNNYNNNIIEEEIDQLDALEEQDEYIKNSINNITEEIQEKENTNNEKMNINTGNNNQFNPNISSSTSPVNIYINGEKTKVDKFKSGNGEQSYDINPENPENLKKKCDTNYYKQASRIYNNCDWINNKCDWDNKNDNYNYDKLKEYKNDNLISNIRPMVYKIPQTLNESLYTKKNSNNKEPCPIQINNPWSNYKTGDDTTIEDQINEKMEEENIPEGFNI